MTSRALMNDTIVLENFNMGNLELFRMRFKIRDCSYIGKHAKPAACSGHRSALLPIEKQSCLRSPHAGSQGFKTHVGDLGWGVGMSHDNI